MSSNRPVWLQTIIEFLIDNVSILFTIGLAGYVVYRQQISQTAFLTNDLLTAILAVLGLLAVSEIIQRYRQLNRIEKFSERTLSLLENSFTDRPSAIAFFKNSNSKTRVQKDYDNLK